MKKTGVKHPERATEFITGGYKDGVIVNHLLFVREQAAVDFNTSEFVLGTIEVATQRTLNNIKSIVEAAGGSMGNFVKCSVHLSAINDFNKFSSVCAEYFTGIKPARTTVHSVLEKGIKIETDAIAILAS